jgi:hypothetical protein
MDGQETLDRMIAIVNACHRLAPEDTLFVLEMAGSPPPRNFGTRSSRIRAVSLQNVSAASRHAGKLVAIVREDREDMPDLELERLWLEGDLEGYAARAKRLLEGGE